MSVLLLAEHDGQTLSANFAKTLTAAQKLGGDVTAVVLGHNAEAVAKQAAAFSGVTKVVLVDDAALATPTAEAVVENLDALVTADTQAVVAAVGTASRGPLARLAARRKAVYLPDLVAIDGNTVTRPYYAGALSAKLDVPAGLRVCTIRFAAFDAAAAGGSAAVEKVAAKASPIHSRVVKVEKVKSSRPELTAARVVVSGGRALGSKENFGLIEQLADSLGAAIGASRAAVDAGYAPNDWQVGQTGKVVAPELYIAVGISGAVQHLAGIKGAKTIVAINKDPNAPIFKMADYGLVADLFSVVPDMVKQLQK